MRYLRSLTTALGTLLAILLSTKIEEIARFISLGAGVQKIFLFVLLQIPYLLQIALPLASIWSGFMTFTSLNHDYLISALRSCNLSVKNILSPLAFITSFIALFFFTLLFDMSAYCHHKSKALEFDVRTSEPLALLVTSQVMQGSDIAFDLKGSLRQGDSATHMLIGFRPSEKEFALVLAEKVLYTDNKLEADNVSFFSVMNGEREERNDAIDSSLLVENAKHVSTPAQHLYEISGAKSWKITEDHLSFGLLLARRQELKQEIAQKALEGKSANTAKKKLNRLTAEVGRRIALSLACITLTLLAAAFAISTRRDVGAFGAVRLIGWATLFSLFFLAAKTLSEKGLLAFAIYTLPHLLILTGLRTHIKRIERGCI